MKNTEFDKLITETLTNEVKKYILENNSPKMEKYHITCEGEFVDTCDSEEEGRQYLENYKKEHPDKEFSLAKGVYGSHDEMIDKLDEMGEQLENNNEMGQDNKIQQEEQFDKESEDCMECGDEMTEEKSVCEKCGKEVCECDSLKESKKKVLRLKESEFVKLIKKMVNEAVPGLDVTKKAQSGSKKDTDSHLSDVDKKIKDYLSFDGNDNPEFPNQIKKGDKNAVNNTDEEDEFVAKNRGKGMQDLKFDHEPSETFKKRQKMAIEGDVTMGNSHDAGNVVDNKKPEKKVIKNAKEKQEEEEEAPMYKKDPAPIKNVNEAVETEIEKIKRLVEYNKKTQ